MSEPNGSAADTSIDALRGLKAAETSWSEKLAKAKADAEAELAALKTDAEAAFAKAKELAEKARNDRVQDAKFKADVEAESVVREGEKEAARLSANDPAQEPGFGAKVVDAVLGPFRSPGGKKGA
jgi:vacuolar-type H+-ATPase subunit H